MIRYRYNSQYMPPAPFVYVTARSLDGTRELELVPAQVDVGADRTVLPLAIANQLGLPLVRKVPVNGLGGSILYLPTFIAQIQIHQLPAMSIEVLASAEEPFVLLGRDMLNSYNLFIYGPQLALEIG